MERAKRGDVAAYEELVCRYQEVAFRTAYITTRDAEAAKDAAQSGFIRAYYTLQRVRPGAPFRPWLLKIVANEARNQVRSARRRSRYELQLVEGHRRDDAAPSPEAAALAGLSRDALLHALNGLPENARQIIVYRYVLDLSETEMADVLGCARGTVKSRLSRALALLRDALAVDTSDQIDEVTHHE